jgi:hypothetical protein
MQLLHYCCVVRLAVCLCPPSVLHVPKLKKKRLTQQQCNDPYCECTIVVVTVWQLDLLLSFPPK